MNQLKITWKSDQDNKMKRSYFFRLYALIIGLFSIVGCSKDEPIGNHETMFQYNIIKDIDSNAYRTIRIGKQTWMADNIRTTRFSNGDTIPTTDPANKDITHDGSGNFQWVYNGEETSLFPYGRLYTWYVVTDERNVCPVGWRVPSDSDWNALIVELGGPNLAAGKLKMTGTTFWTNQNLNANNESGFSAVAGGARGADGLFYYQNVFAGFWSTSQYKGQTPLTWRIVLNYDTLFVLGANPRDGYSVRCLQDK